MTPEDAKQAIISWATGADGLELVSDQGGAGDLSLELRAISATAGPIVLHVTHDPGADRLIIRHVASISGGSAERARELLEGRAGWLTTSVDRSDAGTSAVVQSFVYLDGFSKHTFMQSISEVAQTSRLVGALAATDAAAAAETPRPVMQPQPRSEPVAQPAASQAVPAPSPAAAATPAAQPVGAPTFGSQSQPQYQPQQQQQQYQPQQYGQQQYQPYGQQQQHAPWVPTHSVPPQGLRAWAAPDPNGPVVANLAPGLPIQVAEVRGAWARVVCSNGWVGWIDGRIIGVAA